ncbi:MAG TPA: DUF3775 domain-containing protein [Caulobacterales bacterium]|nr:DUF3775 domain-containing protein [Caulobacterales bacterium]
MREIDLEPEADTLEISHETLARIILKARAYDAQAGVSDPDEGSNPSDDREVSVLEGQSDDPTAAELAALINGLSDDEKIALVALTWIGRGDFFAADWEEAKAMARQRRSGSTARYLMGMPLLGDYLEEGAAERGVNLTIDEDDALEHPEHRRD